MPMRTAYFGLYERANPQAGEVVVVSGAAGAVGSLVVQLARLRKYAHTHSGGDVCEYVCLFVCVCVCLFVCFCV